jgi:signal transduction histidine kinase
VHVAAVSTGRYVQVVIEDDGRGLSPAASQQALVPGRRLDERGDGHGFGLPITQELAELNGGTLSLDKAQLGGLRVALTLPGSQAGE